MSAGKIGAAAGAQELLIDERLEVPCFAEHDDVRHRATELERGEPHAAERRCL